MSKAHVPWTVTSMVVSVAALPTSYATEVSRVRPEIQCVCIGGPGTALGCHEALSTESASHEAGMLTSRFGYLTSIQLLTRDNEPPRGRLLLDVGKQPRAAPTAARPRRSPPAYRAGRGSSTGYIT